jgi:FMN phosphatase YigB (HAD superfamily)
MTQVAPVIFLLDVDNTLLDNDRVIEDLKDHLTQAFGVERQQRYWAIFEKHREQLGYADYLGALQRYRTENPRDPHFLRISYYLLDYPFASRLFPGSLEVIKHLRTWGPAVILSDGDVIFQPRKVQRSGTQLRVDSIRCTTAAGSGHPTSSMSAADLMPLVSVSVLTTRLARRQSSEPSLRNPIWNGSSVSRAHPVTPITT